ncbi:glycoside hydrolase family 2 protein [Ferruginibacter yonginensis]|uniref:beta-mannosidase n=1 Tax=Ferruginibacter yonginensis TaxID=1310416 RepID=A0ABV8QP46_9BACT
MIQHRCKYLLLLFFISLFVQPTLQAQQTITLNKAWQFKKATDNVWHNATVPGSVYTDLYKNKIIEDPFYGTNHLQLAWIDSADWVYKTNFTLTTQQLAQQQISLLCEGLDTYATIYLNNHIIAQTNNMFRSWRFPIQQWVSGNNELIIHFRAAQKITDSIAKAKLPLVLTDNNRVYVRKAAYQFGWDWGPTFINAGIWKPIHIEFNEIPKENDVNPGPAALLQQTKDSIGTSFYFTKNNQPIYIQGSNWIPANIFPHATTANEYRSLLIQAKNAHMNMLRVWGGGIYEADLFYDLCDSIGIMVWQDFMFGNAMYPADADFLSNVKVEVQQQISRLKKHPCIVVWCGNNEIDEAWHQWGWQNQFNIHGADSIKIWNDYKTLFQDSLKAWVQLYDGKRPYISTSPQYGWGNNNSYNNGDSHYWGLWWGLQGWEAFKTKTGRFVSEYGMQAMPSYNSIKNYTASNDRFIGSNTMNAHQKANNGFMKLHYYLNNYFFDTTLLYKLNLEQYSYVTQCLQYYILKNSIITHKNKQPYNMGTLLWQLNDCWPVTSWSIIEYGNTPKAAYYAVKNAYSDGELLVTDSVAPKHIILQQPKLQFNLNEDGCIQITSHTLVKYLQLDFGKYSHYLSDNYIDIAAGETKTIYITNHNITKKMLRKLRYTSFYDIQKAIALP